MAFREPFFIFICRKSLFVENFLNCGKLSSSRKNFYLGRTSLSLEIFLDQEKHFYRKLSCLWKIPMTVENIHDIGKVPRLCKFPLLWKSSLIKKNFLDCRSFPWVWKGLLIKETFHDLEKVPWWRTIFSTVKKFLDQWKLH